MHLQRILIIILAGIGIFSSLMPWIVYKNPHYVSNGLNISDTKLYGLASVLLFAGCILLALKERRKQTMEKLRQWFITALSVGNLAFLIIFMSGFRGQAAEAGKTISGKLASDNYNFGWGLWLAITAALLTILVPGLVAAINKKPLPNAEIVEDIETQAPH